MTIAARILRRDPAAAELLLSEVGADVKAALGDMRRLVRGLSPPALDELGLVDAVRQLAGSFGSDGSVIPIIAITAEQLPDLPAAVEVAGYRIVQDGLTNAVRHAHARHCEVEFEIVGSWLRVGVAHDGIGGCDPGRTGVGTEAMRERAEELDGDCWIERTESGTTVRATMPLTAP